MRSFIHYIAGTAIFITAVSAKLVQRDWEIGWLSRNPDEQFERQVIGINGEWPLPLLECDIHDRIIINVTNKLDEPTSLHFHGIYQNGTAEMDGPVYVTQCPIPAGSNFVYNFTVEQAGTYWYHSHYTSQYPDGLRGLFIIHDSDEPFAGNYDEESYLTVSDWYHDSTAWLSTNKFLTLANPTGAEPIPDYGLQNDTINLKWSVKPNTTYLVRLVNIGALVSQYIWFEDHNITVVEVDGVYVEPYETSMIYITVAQRYTVLLTTLSDTSKNYPFVTSFDLDMLDTDPSFNVNLTGWITYDESGDFPDAQIIDEWDFLDDFYLVPHEKELAWEPDYSITVQVAMINLDNGINYAFFNNITYVAPQVPTLYSVMSSGNDSTDATIYGTNTNTFVLDYLNVVEIVVNNADPGKHPFHLHGHTFQVVERSEASASDDDYITYDASSPGKRQKYPVRRDTVYVRPNGYMVLRFQTDNPGVWLFHCHIEWHLEQGLALVLVEAPLEMQKKLSIPEDHYAACRAGGYSYEGNAAGNIDDLFDLTGEAVQPKDLPAGFTTRGVVAMVFSCISAFVGMGFLSWYGMSDLKTTEREVEEFFGEENSADEETGQTQEIRDQDDIELSASGSDTISETK
ncbi:multicopper oxidase-domain-containing protein [Lipomyces oligophaga]|uniref:multicopper oxidase-domain-containing protein n=1 Tax=Lipomyces oligophaga TaxID=45792 RepID=UPI0034CED777